VGNTVKTYILLNISEILGTLASPSHSHKSLQGTVPRCLP